MIRALLLVCGVTGCGSCVSTQPHLETRSDKDVRDSIGRLSITTSDGGGHCTAWIVAPETIMTSGHCTEREAERSFNGRHAEVIATSEDPDLGLLHVEGLEGEPLPVAGHDPDFGETVTATGYPAGVLLSVTGRWSERDASGDGVMSMVSYFGASGSAVVDRYGSVVCVLQSIRTDYKGATFCVPQDRIRSFLFGHKIQFRRA